MAADQDSQAQVTQQQQWRHGLRPTGTNWARLFARGSGFARTELFRTTQVATRFVSIDWWRSEAAWQAFRESWGEAYSKLDATLQPVAAGGKLLTEGQAETG